MKKSIVYSILVTIISALLFSCESLTPKAKVEIKFDSETQKGWLIADKKDSIKLIGDTTFVHEFTLGQHVFQVNKEKPFVADIEEGGGLLNLSKTKFVRFFQEYRVANGNNNILNNVIKKNKLTILNNLFMIDSTIYIMREDTTIEYSDEEIKEAVTKLGKNSLCKFKIYDEVSYLKKDWDYGLIEELPDEIEVDTKHNYSYLSGTVKTKLMEYDVFMLATIFLSENFIIRDYNEIMNGNKEKPIDKEKTKKQLAF
jgi:hypothetical protein